MRSAAILTELNHNKRWARQMCRVVQCLSSWRLYYDAVQGDERAATVAQNDFHVEVVREWGWPRRPSPASRTLSRNNPARGDTPHETVVKRLFEP